MKFKTAITAGLATSGALVLASPIRLDSVFQGLEPEDSASQGKSPVFLHEPGRGLNSQFAAWMKKHQRNYADDTERNMRQSIFAANFKRILEHNRDPTSTNAFPGALTFTMQLNEYADMTHEEFVAVMFGTRAGPSWSPYGHVDAIWIHNASSTVNSEKEIPAEVDWRTKGLVTSVKKQGQCGACWTFSSTGAVEGQHAKATGTLIDLSEQQLLDCSREDGNNGCKGGLYDATFKYVHAHGMMPLSSYPYEGKEGKCRYDPNKVIAHIKGFVMIPEGNETSLTHAIATVGPVGIGLDASDWRLQFYHSGVYQSNTCSTEAINHGVLAVGYGVENGKSYYLLKNSWGSGWGKGGYFKLARNTNNMCAVATRSGYPYI